MRFLVSEVALYLVSLIWSQHALSRAKVDELVPHNQIVNLRIVQPTEAGRGSDCVNNYFTEMCSGSETGSYLRLIDMCITQL